MQNKNFRITGNTVVTVGSNGKEHFLIDSISPQGIKVQAQTNDGVDVIEFISWDQVTR
jgi:hypothetical protein